MLLSAASVSKSELQSSPQSPLPVRDAFSPSSTSTTSSMLSTPKAVAPVSPPPSRTTSTSSLAMLSEYPAMPCDEDVSGRKRRYRSVHDYSYNGLVETLQQDEGILQRINKGKGYSREDGTNNTDWLLSNYDRRTSMSQSVEHEISRLQQLKSCMILDSPSEAFGSVNSTSTSTGTTANTPQDCYNEMEKGIRKQKNYERFARLACRMFHVPMAIIDVVDLGRSCIVASHGFPESITELPRDVSFSSHAILGLSDVMIVPDTTKDGRFLQNPFVTGSYPAATTQTTASSTSPQTIPPIRFVAAASLVTPNGYKIGSLCLLDYSPRNHESCVVKALEQDLKDMTSMIMDDIMDRKFRYQQQQQIQSNSQAIATAIHELLTPLTAIELSLSVLEHDQDFCQKLQTSPEQKESIQILSDSVKTIGRTCHQLRRAQVATTTTLAAAPPPPPPPTPAVSSSLLASSATTTTLGSPSTTTTSNIPKTTSIGGDTISTMKRNKNTNNSSRKWQSVETCDRAPYCLDKETPHHQQQQQQLPHCTIPLTTMIGDIANAIVPDLIQYLQMAMDTTERNVPIILVVDPHIPRIKSGEHSRIMFQCALCLLRNASIRTEQGFIRLTISASCSSVEKEEEGEDKTTRQQQKQTQEMLVLECEDTGPEIATSSSVFPTPLTTSAIKIDGPRVVRNINDDEVEDKSSNEGSQTMMLDMDSLAEQIKAVGGQFGIRKCPSSERYKISVCNSAQIGSDSQHDQQQSAPQQQKQQQHETQGLGRTMFWFSIPLEETKEELQPKLPQKQPQKGPYYVGSRGSTSNTSNAAKGSTFGNEDNGNKASFGCLIGNDMEVSETIHASKDISVQLDGMDKQCKQQQQEMQHKNAETIEYNSNKNNNDTVTNNNGNKSSDRKSNKNSNGTVGKCCNDNAYSGPTNVSLVSAAAAAAASLTDSRTSAKQLFPISKTCLTKKTSIISRPVVTGTSKKAQKPQLRRGTALIIEDSLVVRKSLGNALSKLGFEPTYAVNGMEGFTHLRETVFDIVFCDFLMPVMDGMDCVQQYRRWEERELLDLEREHNPDSQRRQRSSDSSGCSSDSGSSSIDESSVERRLKTRKPQFILGMSAHASDGDVKRGLHIGMNEYVPKPIRFLGLKKLLEDLIADGRILKNHDDVDDNRMVCNDNNLNQAHNLNDNNSIISSGNCKSENCKSEKSSHDIGSNTRSSSKDHAIDCSRIAMASAVALARNIVSQEGNACDDANQINNETKNTGSRTTDRSSKARCSKLSRRKAAFTRTGVERNGSFLGIGFAGLKLSRLRSDDTQSSNDKEGKFGVTSEKIRPSVKASSTKGSDVAHTTEKESTDTQAREFHKSMSLDNFEDDTDICEDKVCLIASNDAKKLYKSSRVLFKIKRWKVWAAHDGEEALRLLKMRNWDAVLIDDELPLISGQHDCISSFRKWERLNRVNRQQSVIIMTSSSKADISGPTASANTTANSSRSSSASSLCSKPEEETKEERNAPPPKFSRFYSPFSCTPQKAIPDGVDDAICKPLNMHDLNRVLDKSSLSSHEIVLR